MKKIIAFAIATVMAAMLCACSIGECDLCGETGMLSEKSILGVEINVCSDCGG